MIKFNLASLRRPTPSPGVGGKLARELPAAIKAVTEPAFPPKAGLTSEDLAKGYVEERGYPVRPFGEELTRDIPGVDPDVDAAVSQTYDASRPLADYVTQIKTTLSSIFGPAPNTPEDFKASAKATRQRLRQAESVAAHDLAAILSPLTEDMVGDASSLPARAAMVTRQLLIEDTLQQMERDKVTSLHGVPRQKWEETNEALKFKIRTDRGAARASANIRGSLDELFADMVARGWIVRDRYLEGYSPVQKINSVVSGLARVTGEDEGALRAKILSSTKERGDVSDSSIREGNLIGTLHRLRTEYLKKVAQHDFFQELVQSPWNMTNQFGEGATLPRGVAAYYPGPGMVGYMFSSPEKDMLDGVIAGLDPEGKMGTGRYIFPEELVRGLKNLEPPRAPKGSVEVPLFNIGRAISQSITVYSVASTQLNRISDPVVALMGLPGEKAQPLGFMKFYFPAAKLAKEFVNGRPAKIIIRGKEIDVSDILARQGVATSTSFSDISGHNYSAQLLKLLPEEERDNEGWFRGLGWMERDREQVELTPRIAAGLEALERTGSIDEFGRVAREITLNYNEGAPELSEQVLMRFIAPFVKFTGLASSRVFKLATTPGSRGRTLTAIAAVPTLFMMWNYQNEEYRRVENSLSQFERDQLHFIVPGPDWRTPRRDSAGNPIVIRVRYYVPEEIAKTAGLGNLPSRFARVAAGRDTPIEFLQSVPTTAAKNIGDMMVIPSLAYETLSGKSRYGQELSIPDRILRLMPTLRIPKEAAMAYKNAPGDVGDKLGAAAWSAFPPLLGMSTVAGTQTRGGVSLDADLNDAKRALREQKQVIKNLVSRGKPAEIAAARRKYDELLADYQRIRAIYIQEREAYGKRPSYRSPEMRQEIRQSLEESDQQQP